MNKGNIWTQQGRCTYKHTETIEKIDEALSPGSLDFFSTSFVGNYISE